MNPAWVSQLLNRSQTKVSIQDYDCFSCFFIFGEGITPRGSLPNSPITSRPAAGAPPAALGLGAAFFCFFSEASEASDWRPLEKASGSSGQPDFGWEGTEGTSYLFGPSPYRSDSYVKISKSHDISYIIIHYHTINAISSRIKTWNVLNRTAPHLRGWAGALLSLLSHHWRFNETRPSTSAQKGPFSILQPNGKRSHDHSLKSWEHPWAIHNISLQQEILIRPAVSMRFPRNLVSPQKRTSFWWLMVECPSCLSVHFHPCQAPSQVCHPRSPHEWNSGATFRAVHGAFAPGTGGGSPWIYRKDSDCRGKMMKLWMKIDMDSELLILCITILN